MCQDGGDIWKCDKPSCQCAVCTNCVKIPAEELDKLQDPNVKFTCLACHWSWRRSGSTYFVGSIFAFFMFLLLFIYLFSGFYN